MNKSLITFKDVMGITDVCSLDKYFPISFNLESGEIGIFKSGFRASSLALMAAFRGIITHGSIKIMDTMVHASDDPAKYLSHKFTKQFVRSFGFCHNTGGLLANMSILENVILPAYYHSENRDPKPFYEIARTSLDEINVPEEYWNSRPTDVPFEFQKRSLLARSIMNDPEILILDEPTEHLSWVQTHEVVNWVLRQKEYGRGILIATSNDPFACLLGDWMIDFDNNGILLDEVGMELLSSDLIVKGSELLKEQSGEVG